MGTKIKPLTYDVGTGKNGVYCNLVKHVREAFEECELVRVNCQGLNKSDTRRIGAKLKVWQIIFHLYTPIVDLLHFFPKMVRGFSSTAVPPAGSGPLRPPLVRVRAHSGVERERLDALSPLSRRRLHSRRRVRVRLPGGSHWQP